MPGLTKKKTKAKKRAYKQSLPMDKNLSSPAHAKRAWLHIKAKNQRIRRQIKELEKSLYPQKRWASKLCRGK